MKKFIQNLKKIKTTQKNCTKNFKNCPTKTSKKLKFDGFHSRKNSKITSHIPWACLKQKKSKQNPHFPRENRIFRVLRTSGKRSPSPWQSIFVVDISGHRTTGWWVNRQCQVRMIGWIRDRVELCMRPWCKSGWTLVPTWTLDHFASEGPGAFSVFHLKNLYEFNDNNGFRM